MTVTYDGSLFHGWQMQSGLRTVQGELQDALLKVTGQEIILAGTSRTDAGVHAIMQCMSFKADLGIPTEKLPKALNNMLCGGRYGEGSKGSDVRVLAVEEMPEDFHARFDCKGKTYRYVFSQTDPNVFRKNYCYYVDGDSSDRALDINAMKEAASYLVGTQDFEAFQSSGGTPRETTVRTVFQADIVEAEDVLTESKAAVYPHNSYFFDAMIVRPGDMVFCVTGDGFLYNMVRIMAGTIIEVGLGKIKPDELPEIIESKDRSKAGHTAPACGLYLYKIYFDENFKQGFAGNK